MNPQEKVIYSLLNTPVRQYPFPHFQAFNVFPDDFYRELLLSLPDDSGYKPLSGGYANRVAAIEENPLVEFMNTPRFAQAVLSMFPRAFNERFAYGKGNFRTDVRFIRDSEGYKIGPHTDAPAKVVSLLFYLSGEDDFSLLDHGTGVFVPDEGVQTCRGGPHYKFDGFTEVFRAKFLPNSCFGFWKTANSWHGVEKIPQISGKIRRDVMLYNIYSDEPKNGHHQGTVPE